MMAQSRSLPLCVLAGALLCSMAAPQTTTSNVRIAGPIDANQLVTLRGEVNPSANARNDRGPVSTSLPLPDLTLVLSRSPERQAAFDAFVASQYDPSSPNFHVWLTPQEIGQRFGPSEADIQTISNWLTSQGFIVKRIPPDRMTIPFSGTAGQAERAFHTQIHNLMVDGVPHYGNMTAPQIPAALAPVVVGVTALHNFLPRPQHVLGSLVQFNPKLGGWQRVMNTASAIPAAGSGQPAAGAGPRVMPAFNFNGPHPEFGINGGSGSSAFLEEDVTPYDFATIYNVLPLWNAGINGTGETIAIDGTSEICLGQSGSPCNGNNDVATYRKAFGLPAYTSSNAPKQIDSGLGTAATLCTSTSSSAYCGINDLLENTLDVEVSGAVAPGAQIDLVVTGQNSSGTIDTVYDSAKYVVDNKLANILSLSYGACELSNGTAENVKYYDLWQQAASEGIAVFAATGDSGSPSCDQGMDASGVPYSAQYGLAVSGIASTPYNVAVGGTDFSWCQPYYTGSGSNATLQGCPSTSSGAAPYWNASNNTSNEPGESATNYIPETPWNDSCENPIWTKFLESIAPLLGYTAPTSAEGACNFVENNWYAIYNGSGSGGYGYYGYYGGYGGSSGPMLAGYVDTVGGGGGSSNCVVNSSNPTSTTSSTIGTCSSSANSTGTANGSIPLVNDGWPAPSWQVQSGVTGTSGLTQRAIPDVSFFSGDGALDSATLICVSLEGSCVTSVSSNVTTEPTAQEVGGTSVATPEMAGVMALINQKAGSPQGDPDKVLYTLASRENYSNCSAESVKNSSGCYYQSIDQGTNAMPCSLGIANDEGGAINQNGTWVSTTPYTGKVSPNCTALIGNDQIGTLMVPGTTTPAYDAAAGFNMATGLGSLNVANVVDAPDAWVGSAASTVTLSLSPSTGISSAQSLSVTVTVAGSSGSPTGTVTLSGGGYTSSAETLTSGSVTFNVPAGSFTGSGSSFNVTLTATYSGDPTYAQSTGTASVTVTKATPTVTVAPGASSINSNIALPVLVSVSGGGSNPTPTGTLTLSGGGYTSAAETLSGGAYTFTIPASTFGGFTGTQNITLTATYSGSNAYASGTGSNTVSVTYVPVVAPAITFNPPSPTVYLSQSLPLTVTVGGSNGAATGTVTLSGSGYTSATETLSGGSYTFTIPGNTLTGSGNPFTATLTAAYIPASGSDYAHDSATVSVKVTQATYSLTAGAASPSSGYPGQTYTATISGAKSSTNYTRTVTPTQCALTSSTVTNPAAPPTCSVSGTITYSNGTPSGAATATVVTTKTTVGTLVYPKASQGKGWLGAGGGAMLAFLVFLGIPTRRKSWRSMLGLVVLMAVLGGLSACGGYGNGGGGQSGPNVPGTSAGTYTFTVTGASNPTVNPEPTVNFSVTVN